MKLLNKPQIGRYLLAKSFLRRMVQKDKNIKQMSHYAQETGRSIVEMLVVLAIIGVLSVSGIAGYSKAMFKHKMNKTINIISHILMGLTQLSTMNISIFSFDNQAAIKIDFLSPNHLSNEPSICNKYPKLGLGWRRCLCFVFFLLLERLSQRRSVS